MKTILWLSRHHMGDDQLEDLKSSLSDDIEVITKNITWAASGDSSADIATNQMIWAGLMTEITNYPHVVIAGVFPPVALESFISIPSKYDDGIHITLMSPVSKQDKTIRENGEAVIEFIHLRWATVAYRG